MIENEASVQSRNAVMVSYALTVSGEAAQAAFHFFLNVVLIRQFEFKDYGIFAVVFTVGSICVLNVNCIFGQPINIFLRRCRAAAALSLEVTMGSMALLACILFGLLVAIIAVFGLSDLSVALFAGAFVFFWPLRIYVKAVTFARLGKRAACRSTISDLLYSGSSSAFLAFLHFTLSAPFNLALVFASLCVGNLIGILVTVSGRRRPMRLRFDRRTFCAFMKLLPEIRWSLVGTVSTTVLGQSQMGFVTLLLGPAAYAPLAAGFVLMSPIRILTLAVNNIMRSDLAHINARGDHSASGRMVARAIAALAACCLAYGAFLWVGWPLLKVFMFGERFGAEPMAAIVALAWVLTSLSNVTQLMEASVQARSRFSDAAWPMLGGCVITLFLVPSCLIFFGPVLSTLGPIIGEFASLTLLLKRHALAADGLGRGARYRSSGASGCQNESVGQSIPVQVRDGSI